MNISEFLNLFELQFLDSLVEFDTLEAQRVRKFGCPHCGGKLDSGDYWRKPRGVKSLLRRHCRRRSLCCRQCRKRTTPASACFLGRKVHLGIVVIVISYLRERREAVPLRRLAALSGASEVSIRRWLMWWKKVVSASDFWRAERSRFIPAPGTEPLILLLGKSFRSSWSKASDAFRALCLFVSPLAVPAHYPS